MIELIVNFLGGLLMTYLWREYYDALRRCIMTMEQFREDLRIYDETLKRVIMRDDMKCIEIADYLRREENKNKQLNAEDHPIIKT